MQKKNTMTTAETAAEKIIKRLNLQPHPEGGYFAETYRCEETIPASALSGRYTGKRSLGTAIYFLLAGREVSCFHRLKTDEIWHFYCGSPMVLHFLGKDGGYETRCLGPNILREQCPQITVYQGNWFGVTVKEKQSFTLAGCTTAPGFDFADFELAERQRLLERYPQHADIIKKLTPDPD